MGTEMMEKAIVETKIIQIQQMKGRKKIMYLQAYLLLVEYEQYFGLKY
jgi:hypothetical protein